MALIDSRADRYGGLKIDSKFLNDKSVEGFESALEQSLAEWKQAKIGGIWFRIDIKDSHLIPVLVKHEFIFHHAQPDFVMMTRWLKTHLPSPLPRYAHTQIGVGGLVVDDEGRVLMMREKRGWYLGWKFPGGVSDPGETIFDTASREVFEETGVQSEGVAVLCFRQIATSQFKGVGDIYFVCVMRLRDKNNTTIKACERETADAKWFSREEINQLPEDVIHDFHKQIFARYDMWKESGRRGCYKDSIYSPHRSIDMHMFFVE